MDVLSVLSKIIRHTKRGADRPYERFHKIKLSNLHKIWKYNRKSGKLSTKSRKIGTSHSQY